MRWTLTEVADALGISASPALGGRIRLAGVSIDSRTVKPVELFIAIRGPRHDGHAFVADVLAGGAAAVVVAKDRLAEYSMDVQARLLGVADTSHALRQLATKYCDSWRKAMPGRRVAAITGSTGKTTTKEILAAILATRMRVLKSEGNLNNEFGLPLTLLRLTDEHDAAVVEMGMSSRGEIARLAEIARPDMGVVTNVAPVHLEFFSSVDDIALAKRELIEGLKGNDPVAVLNADDERVKRFKDAFAGRVRSFGLSQGAEFRADNIVSQGLDGSEFDFHAPSDRARLRLGLAGTHNIMNTLAALAAAREWNIGSDEAKLVLPALEAGSLRGQVLRFAKGFTVINDCYNSNPVALERMMDLLCATPGYQRRVLIAGAWREIGATSTNLHRAAGEYATRKRGIDWIIGVEGDASDLVRGAIDAGHPRKQTAFFKSSAEATGFLLDFVHAGDLLLVKGSRGVHMETIVSALREKFPLAGNSGEATLAGKSGKS